MAHTSSPRASDLASQIRLAAEHAGWGDGEFRLIHTAHNLVFRNDVDRIIARVAAEHIPDSDLIPRLAHSQTAFESGAPIVPPLTPDPIMLGCGRWASLWPLAAPPGSFDGHDLARLAMRCHVTTPPRRLTEWNPRARVPHRLASLEQGVRAGLPQAFATRLETLFFDGLKRLETVWRSRPRARSVLVHGDFYHRNLVRWQGHLSLCDTDNLCCGPREIDLAYISYTCRRYLDAEWWEQCQQSYPEDFDTELPEALVRVQEVGAIMFGCASWAKGPTVQDEIIHEINTLDDPHAAWVDF